jgi:hypothetical protein
VFEADKGVLVAALGVMFAILEFAFPKFVQSLPGADWGWGLKSGRMARLTGCAICVLAGLSAADIIPGDWRGWLVAVIAVVGTAALAQDLATAAVRAKEEAKRPPPPPAPAPKPRESRRRQPKRRKRKH